ncbi:MAG: DNA polymerase Y family protein, partial [Mycobacterium sp.]|nr:DNA polymerase Y family protein [Mycobacterium sp.]
LLDAQGDPVRVSARGLFTAEPARLNGTPAHRGALSWWAGPWPVDDRWWDQQVSGRTARAQVLLDGDPPRALLLCYRRRRWCVEGVYE